MNFSYAGIHAALGPTHVPSDDKEIDLPELETSRRLAVGRDGSGSFVLVAPGQPKTRRLEGRQFQFEPWTELVDRRSSIILRDVSLLRFRPLGDDSEVRDAVSAVFSGLVELSLVHAGRLG